jgi:dihydrofolate reductase
MRKLIYSLGPSLDGFIADRDGSIDWSAHGDDLFRFHTEQTRELDAQLLGRGLYDTMLYWETAAENPDSSELELEFAAIWNQLPKIVFSSTLTKVEGNAELATGSVAEVVARLKAEPGKDIAVGGGGLAGACIELDLIDEYRLFLNPVVLGGGTPYFAARADRLNLELVETRTFREGVVYLRYRRL